MLLIALSATSCKSLIPTPTTLTRQTDTLIVCQTRTDTLIRFRTDSASVLALLRCDSLGQVLIDSLTTLQGRRLHSSINLHSNGSRTALEVRSITPQDSLRIPTQTSTITQRSSSISEQVAPQPPSLAARARSALQGLGLILIGILIGFILRSLI